MEHATWADQGVLLTLDEERPENLSPCLGVSRLGSMHMATDLFTVWIQLHGSIWVEAREGKFQLFPGHWIALEKDSRPLLQADRHGVCIGVGLASEALVGLAPVMEAGLYAGRGRTHRGHGLCFLRLWRQAERTLRFTGRAAALPILRALLLNVSHLQRDVSERMARCPGPSLTRKRQVFGRMQRALLFLEGNCDRVVRIGELADLTSFSTCYFSRTFLSLYGESPQAAGARLRLEHAAQLLRNESLTVGEVAAASGFDNCCSFARAFRARFGLSATQYRAAMRLSTDSARSLVG